MQITEYVCDECGKKRTNDTNHWRKIGTFKGGFFVENKYEWTADDQADVCGQDCAVKVFSRWLSTGKLKAEVPNGKSS